VVRNFKIGVTLTQKLGKACCIPQRGDFTGEVCTGKAAKNKGRSRQLLQTHTEAKGKNWIRQTQESTKSC